VFGQQRQFSVSRSDESLKSFLGLFFTVPLIVITLFYMNTQFQTLTDHQDTSVNILNELHTPYNRFSLPIGKETEDENYKFSFAFALYDVVNVQSPQDIDKIGKLRAYLLGWVYNIET